MKSRAEYYTYHNGEEYRSLTMEEVFARVYRQEKWNVLESQASLSGPGSSLEQTHHLLQALPLLFEKHGVQSVLDIPCGDFNWMRHLDWGGRKYIGADIVEDLISENRRAYASYDVRFERLDITEDRLPQVDCVICRDCLVHFSFNHINEALRNIRESGSRYLLTTTFPAEASNRDIPTGGWRPIDLRKPPFSLPEPLELINEHCAEANGLFSDKSMGLWPAHTLAATDERR